MTENGLEAKVRTQSRGLGKVKANLRSVLNEEEEELEIIPHVKGQYINCTSTCIVIDQLT